jgi:hypothetical protein
MSENRKAQGAKAANAQLDLVLCDFGLIKIFYENRPIVGEQVTMPPFLIKHIYSRMNQGNGGTAPHIVNLGIR